MLALLGVYTLQFPRHAMRLASSELRHENRDEMWSENSSPQRGQIISGELSINFINLNFKFDYWLLDHQCIILIDPLMETQLFENENASTEII